MESQRRSILPLFGAVPLLSPLTVGGYYQGFFGENITTIAPNYFNKNVFVLPDGTKSGQGITNNGASSVRSWYLNNVIVLNNIGTTGYAYDFNLSFSLGQRFSDPLMYDYTFFIIADNLDGLTTFAKMYSSVNSYAAVLTEMIAISREAATGFLQVKIQDDGLLQSIILSSNITANQLNIIVIKYDSTLKKLDLWINGINFNSTNALLGTVYFGRSGSSNYGNDIFFTSSPAPTIADSWIGMIGDCYLYNILLSNTDINKVANYMKNKFAGTWTDI